MTMPEKEGFLTFSLNRNKRKNIFVASLNERNNFEIRKIAFLFHRVLGGNKHPSWAC